MTRDKTESDRLAELRRRADAKLKRETLDLPDMSTDEIRNLIHELRTHQVELELQNDELRRSEELLIESRDRHVDLYDFAPVGYVTVSNKGLILEANLTLADMLGVESETLLKQRLSAFIVPDDEEIFYLHHKELLDTKQRRTCQLRMVRRDAEPFWVEMGSKPKDTDDESDVRYRTAISDITELKQAERSLLDSEEKHRILFESSQDAIMTLSPPSWKFTSGNPACVAMFGARDEAEFTSHPPWTLSPEHQPDGRPSAEKAKEMIDTAVREGSHVFEWTHKKLDGTEFSANVSFKRSQRSSMKP